MTDVNAAAEFGDADPEDAWDDSDSVELKVRVLERVIESLRNSKDDARFEFRRNDALRLVNKLLSQQARIADLRDELEDL